MSALSESIGRRFTVTSEVKPPRGPDASKMMDELDAMRGLRKLLALNVIDSPSARLLMSSLGASIILKQNGIEPIFQMVCRDRNLLALESDLLSASAFGIENVLALTGDHPSRGASDHPNVRPIYDLDSTSLIRTISMMNKGRDPAGVELNAKTSFFVGGAVNPNVRPLEPEVLKMARKTEAGASFFQSQAVFDAKCLQDFASKMDELVGDLRPKVLVGIIPLASEKMVAFLNRLPGMKVPDAVASRVLKAKDPQTEGVAVSLELIDEIKKLGFGGVHIMPVGRINSLAAIVREL
ncbi:MAG: methylenetetrahydrofolate reductase [Candidatus Altiarchaeota archaeon]